MPADEISTFETAPSPEEAVARLIVLYDAAIDAQRHALERFFATQVAPTAEERAKFRYPELRVIYRATSVPPIKQRAYAKFQGPGVYATTITQPAFFRNYLLEQLNYLVSDYGATIQVGVSDQEIPYPYVFERGDELGRGAHSAAELAQFFPTPLLAKVGDEIADGTWEFREGEPRPLSLFDAARTDYSLRRLVHYTGSDWRSVQPWILLTNYHRYVDQFVRWAISELASENSPFIKLVLPSGVMIERGLKEEAVAELVGSSPWHRFQMPAYHLIHRDGHGVTLVNIGVGPSNAKNVTDHLAVVRPHCWLMVGHCGGLRQSQTIGDYVLAHGYLRRDHILDDAVPPEIPIPALAEVQVALQEAAAQVTGQRGDALKRRLRTGTVVTYDDRNWELRWTQERRQINLSRAIAVDMESGTIAAQGYRLRVPYGTLLCVSDKPLHGEIKLPGAANAFYERAVSEHLMIGLVAVDILRGQRSSLHSRKLRSFDEPPFR
ncbi:AMP nucleosidase [Microvirga brassicacearum]|uniref:AMP nucleosidase n=1 Tax=Microvirga brassicacearum TaxID=2580413 RepID=A0A5N3PBB6_9HYPH|nr:AMP nucleosidase [Microvirga brassicacearum]KAB0267046.1 AMP nucleosidase [Microvirga brassicacearum]